MAPTMVDIAPINEWTEALENNLIRSSSNGTASLNIYSYVTKNVHFAKNWSPVTEASRGLIINGKTNEIVARPFKKFFNWSEFSDIEQKNLLEANPQVIVSDKLDGSLGILYTDPDDGEAKIATRGSLTGEHAVAATRIYRENYDGKWSPKDNYTYLFEILMDGAGIVISYAEEELVLIGRVNNETGVSTPLNEIDEWPFKRAEILPYANLKEVLDAPERPHKEGVVVHIPDGDVRFKLKYEDFIRLHRIGSGISRYRVWEALESGVNMEEWKPFLEEEFYSFVDEVSSELTAKYNEILTEANEAYETVKGKFGSEYNRKEFAVFVNGNYPSWISSFILNREFNPTPGVSENRLWALVAPQKDFK